jgi:hypothetical protein
MAGGEGQQAAGIRAEPRETKLEEARGKLKVGLAVFVLLEAAVAAGLAAGPTSPSPPPPSATKANPIVWLPVNEQVRA